MYHYLTCSPMDALQWMGAVRMRVQTADKNITIIHTTPVHQLMSWTYLDRVHFYAVLEMYTFLSWFKLDDIFVDWSLFILMTDLFLDILWHFYQLFRHSFWRHPFTAEDPVMSMWCNAKFLQICSDEETNSSTSWMACGWVHFQQIFISEWTIPFSVMKFPDHHIKYSTDISVWTKQTAWTQAVTFMLHASSMSFLAFSSER